MQRNWQKKEEAALVILLMVYILVITIIIIYLDTLTLTGKQGRWEEQLPEMQNLSEISSDTNPYDTMIDLVSQRMPDHQICTSKTLLNMIRDLDYGFTLNGMQTQ